MTDQTRETGETLTSTGIEGLDTVLNGGLSPNRFYLLEGDPGSGKTTLALQFLLEGLRNGETCLFVALSESADELEATARSHEWSLDGLHVEEITASEESLRADARYTMYHPSEVELAETTRRVLDRASELEPDRVVIDSLSEFRLLAENPLRYRRQILSLKQAFSRRGVTVMMIDDRTGETPHHSHLSSLAHGVISLDVETPAYGPPRRRIRVAKLRGRRFSEGEHDFVLRTGGIEVFPRLVAARHAENGSREPVRSGLDPLDELLGGGLARGTSTLLVGASGSGKSSVASLFAQTVAEAEGRASVFLFDESESTFLARSSGLGMNVGELAESGRISIRQVDPAELSPGEFAVAVRREVEEHGSRLVVIDSLTGYLQSMPSERYLLLHLHELLTYLDHRGVTTVLVMTHHGVTGEPVTPIDASYVSDTLILFRFFEAHGEIRKAISVVKKRAGGHEPAIRELRLEPDRGVALGEPLRDFRGVLSGSPVFVGESLGKVRSSHDA